ncbi:MAG: hypothetical protein V4760_10255 [Bdellovibrionota bacterium]
MRSFLALILMLTFVGAARAQEAAPDSKMVAAMKIIGANFKAIGMQSSDPTAFAALVPKVQELRAQVLSIVGETPAELAKSVPAEQLPLARLGYEKLMLTLAAQSVDLEAALRKGSAADVETALDAMSDTKSDGHDQFKP